jgi:hypothetical protein
VGLAHAAETPEGESGEATQPAGTAERVGPQVEAAYVETAPVVDGKLDDACWSQAARLEGFFAPGVEAAPPEETIAYICLDDTAFYVGFECRDRTPEDITAAETRRNGNLWEDDTVEFMLDPNHQHGDYYFFRANARGTQGEDIPGGSATKIEWRGDWRAATSRTPEGWAAEMEIPFSILRYRPGQSTWGFFVSRHFARERLWVLHPVTGGKALDDTLACDMVGVRPPPYTPRPIWMPYVTLDFGDAIGERYSAGLDVQYRMVNGLTALTTLNPDFKQIEDVVEPIAFSYTERHLPDQRPFFVTGQGYLPGSRMLYTRRIEDFDVGAKLFGRMGKERIGLLNAMTLGEQNVLATQWEHKFSDDFSSTFKLVTDARKGEPENTVYGFGTYRMRRCDEGGDGLGAAFRHSKTKGMDRGSVYEVFGFRFRGSGELGWDWHVHRATPDFNPRLGYYHDQDSFGGHFALGKWQHYETGAVESQGWRVVTEHVPRLEGKGVLRTGISPSYSRSWRNGRSVHIGFTRGQQYGEDSSEARFRYGWNRSDIHRRGGLFIVKGVRAGGDYTYYTLDQGFRPMKDVSVTLATEYTHVGPPSPDAAHEYQAVLTMSYDLTDEKCVSARVIKRDAGTTVFLGYRQVVRRGMDAYVLIGDPDPATTGFTKRAAVKLIWVF